MPRYDHDRERFGPSGQPMRNAGPAGPGLSRGAAYGGDFRPHAGWGGGDAGPADGRGGTYPGDGEWESGPVYGPARYGLGPYHQRLRTRRRPDDEVRREVEDALFYDTWVDAEAISVDVRDGVVTLRGELPDYHEVRYATDDAWDVDGVRGVHCQLTVNGALRPPLNGVPRESSGAGNG